MTGVITMINCHCKERSDAGRGLPLRPRLFNWMTVALLTVWVLLVALIAENSGRVDRETGLDVRSFMEQLF